jgi:hypothetical protein
MKFETADDREVYVLGAIVDAYDNIAGNPTTIARPLQQRQCGADDNRDGNGDPNIVYPPDDRVNWQLGDDVALTFSVNNSDNNPASHIYQPATDGVNPNRPLVITRADLPRPMPPAVDTWIAGEGLVNVYVC